jgi:hypothetical protein
MAVCRFCNCHITPEDPDYRAARWSETMDALVVAHRRCLKEHNRKLSRKAFLRVARRRFAIPDAQARRSMNEGG